MAHIVITTLFPKSLTGTDSEVRQFKDAVEDHVRRQGGKLEHFAVESGIVSFGVNDEAIARGIKVRVEEIPGVSVSICTTPMEAFVEEFNFRRRKQRS